MFQENVDGTQKTGERDEKAEKVYAVFADGSKCIFLSIPRKILFGKVDKN